MKRRRTRNRELRIRVYTPDEARKALPYVASVAQSLREHRLEALSLDRQARLLDARPGRPDTRALIAQQEAARAAREANDRFEAALEELNALDVYCLDPVRGEVLIPFAHGDQLAWYVYDLFAGEELRHWRLHTDPLEARRPVDELAEGNGSTAPGTVAV